METHTRFDYPTFLAEISRGELDGAWARFALDAAFDIRALVLALPFDRISGTTLTGMLKNLERTLASEGARLVRAALDVEAQWPFDIRSIRFLIPPLESLLVAPGAREEIRMEEEFQQVATIVDSGMSRTAAQLLDACQDGARSSAFLSAKLARPEFARDAFAGAFGLRSVTVDNGFFESFIEVLPSILASTERLFAFAEYGDAAHGIDQVALSLIAGLVPRLGNRGAKFAAAVSVPLHGAYFPTTYHDTGSAGISIASAGAGVITQALRDLDGQDSRGCDAAVRRIAEAEHLLLRTCHIIGERVAAQLGVRFFGADLTQAPVFSDDAPGRNSVGAAIERLSGVPLGGPGTLAAFRSLICGLRRGSEKAGVPLVGYRGEFLPVSEDDVLARRVHEGHLGYADLLSLQEVCASGIDMLIVPPDTSAEDVSRVLADAAAIALHHGKMQAVRLIVHDRDACTDARGYVILGGLLGAGPAYRLPLSREHPASGSSAQPILVTVEGDAHA